MKKKLEKIIFFQKKFFCQKINFFLKISKKFQFFSKKKSRKIQFFSSNMYESGIALGGLSCFVTPDLARDLAADVVNLLSCSRNYTRKRAVLLLYKIFLKYPDALRPTFPRLKEKLEDPDPGVQSSAVNVICELARKNPKNYLTLAPVFFKLMTTSSNNWMLIKIIKLVRTFRGRNWKKSVEN